MRVEYGFIFFLVIESRAKRVNKCNNIEMNTKNMTLKLKVKIIEN